MTSTAPRKSRAPVMIAVVVLIAIAAVGVFTYYREPRLRTLSDQEQAGLRYMKSDLEGLLLTEATTNRSLGRYVVEPEQAGMLSTVGVDKPKVHVTGKGWWATITSPAVPDVECAIAVDVPNPFSRRARTGQ